ncbi:DNA recombination protein RmuC [Actinomadura bangladeshensis]|uniref:DNA recombination protein RmuC n=1 Tax=Actinomadura bangladeshensis TaxID=453573 RepID=A0A6L9QNT9_9ACTN|nr:DNA recombination protein RmuC [Actinomadura bangladeshensis]NEA27171.1 DNA recombination protein RmuC [Actinomadura bangladeshensis]
MDLALLAGLLLGAVFGAVAGYALATSRQGALIARARAAEEKLAYAEDRMAEHFENLSAKALDASNQRFLELADARLKAAGAEAAGDLQRRQQAVEHLVAPLKETLAKVEEQLREVETGRRESHAMLAKQVDFVRQSSDQLRRETQSLVRALQRPEARGRWGELQLRRVVELAGMTHHCDFDEQASAVTADGTVRPDMVVRLAGGKSIVVDSKVSLAAYLQAAESGDPVRLDAHARHLRDHVDRLAAKSYWQAFSPAPEFVVLFIPGEAFLAPALDRDPGLLEYAMRRRVHIATPTTLITMLRTASYAWQQAALSRNARAVFELGKELYERLGTMGHHVDELGRALTGAIKSYNRTVGSLETRVLVSARKLNELGVVDDRLDGPRPVEESPRALSAAELTAAELTAEDHISDGHQDGEELRPAPGAEAVGFGSEAIPEQIDRRDRPERSGPGSAGDPSPTAKGWR